MLVFGVITIILNCIYVVVGFILHLVTFRELPRQHRKFITVYGIIWTYDDWVAPLRILFIILLLPFTIGFELLFLIGTWMCVLLQYYGRNDYDFIACQCLKYKDDYILSCAVLTCIIRWQLRISPYPSKRHGKAQQLVEIYFGLDNYYRERLSEYFDLPLNESEI